MSKSAKNFQEIVSTLNDYWSQQGCTIVPAYDLEMGAGTFHPATTLQPLAPKPWKAAYLQKVRRPGDGRYALNPNRLQSYFQYQVILKPAPDDVQKLYLGSLEAIGIAKHHHDIRFIEDNWASPTIGATGLGWEVWCNGIEVTQFTYFQQICGHKCSPSPVEITYGTERLAMVVQDRYSAFELDFDGNYSYGDLFAASEREQSLYNYQGQDTKLIQQEMERIIQLGMTLLKSKLSLPAYEACIKASHLFNLLDARQTISTSARQSLIIKIRDLACACADTWLESNSTQPNVPPKTSTDNLTHKGA